MEHNATIRVWVYQPDRTRHSVASVMSAGAGAFLVVWADKGWSLKAVPARIQHLCSR